MEVGVKRKPRGEKGREGGREGTHVWIFLLTKYVIKLLELEVVKVINKRVE